MSEQHENGSWQQALLRIEEALRSKSSELDLSTLKLTSLPESLGQLAKLEMLDLSDNQLTEIPELISRLLNLQRLSFTGNQLTAIEHLARIFAAELQQLRRSLLFRAPHAA